MTQKLIQSLQCCFPGHKQFPGNQSAQVPSQHCIGGRGGEGVEELICQLADGPLSAESLPTVGLGSSSSKLPILPITFISDEKRKESRSGSGDKERVRERSKEQDKEKDKERDRSRDRDKENDKDRDRRKQVHGSCCVLQLDLLHEDTFGITFNCLLRRGICL